MKYLLWIGLISVVVFISGCASHPVGHHHATNITKPAVVDAACGQCLLGLKGEKKGCDLAVHLDGHSYFVDGFTMKQLGDAHSNDGMCNTIRRAKVTGHIENGRFAATSFEILPLRK